MTPILGDPGAVSRGDGIFIGESLQQERESPWEVTLTDPVPEAFEFSPSDWPEKYFSGKPELDAEIKLFWPRN